MAPAMTWPSPYNDHSGGVMSDVSLIQSSTQMNVKSVQTKVTLSWEDVNIP
jgi:hypothetical protein